MSSERRVRLGILGVGRMGLFHALNLSAVPEAELMALADPDEKRAKRAAELTGVERWYSDPDQLIQQRDVEAIIISTPSDTHAKATLRVFEARKDVLCEKPLATDLRDAEKVIEGARETGVKLQVGFMRRFDTAYAGAKKKIDDGVIGKPTIFTSNSRDPFPPPAWACDPRKGGGLPIDMHSHDYDLARWLMGSEVRRIHAEGETLVYKEIKQQIPEFVDNIVISLKFQNGSLGAITGSQHARYGYDVRTEVLGSDGAVQIGELKRLPLTVCTASSISNEATYKGNEEPHFVQRFHQAYVDMLRYFVRCIREDVQPSPSGPDGKAALQLALAVMESLKTAKPIELG
jgi:predicted dehydrogenase